MENCFINKLDVTINNNNIGKFGELKFYSGDGSDITSSDYAVDGTGVTATVDGDCLIINNKYNLNSLTLRPAIKMEIKQIHFCPLTFLNLQAECDLSNLSYLPNTIEDFRRSASIGDTTKIELENIKHLIALTNLNIYGLNGEWESFIEYQIAKGRTSMQLSIQSSSNSTTFNGNTWNCASVAFSLQQGSDVLFDVDLTQRATGTHKYATYNKSTNTWSYTV